MKNILKYIIFFILIIFIVPALLTRRNKNNILLTSENIENSNIKLNDYKKIKLLHSKTNEIEEVNLEDYICNVVSAEMPADYEKEALKAQAIVARTYLIYQIEHNKHENCDICDNSNCCQAWISKEERFQKWGEHAQENWNKIGKCVEETQGVIITYNNQPINAFFHSNSGGTTETPKDVWGGEDFPYLQTVQTSGEEGYKQFESKVEIKNEDLINKLKSKYEDIQIDFSKDDDLRIIEYTRKRKSKNSKIW